MRLAYVVVEGVIMSLSHVRMYVLSVGGSPCPDQIRGLIGCRTAGLAEEVNSVNVV